MTVAAVFWLVGLACLIAALAGKGVKISTVELPAFAATATRLGAALVGLLALGLGTVVFLDRDGPAPVGAGQTTRAPATTQPGGPGRTDPPGAPPPTAGDLEVLWHGTMTVADGSGVDVGRMPVQVQGILGSSFYFFDGFVRGELSEWTSDADPIATTCADQLRTHPAQSLRPRAGLRFCTYGDATARIAYVRIVSFEAAVAEIEVTIWNLQL